MKFISKNKYILLAIGTVIFGLLGFLGEIVIFKYLTGLCFGFLLFKTLHLYIRGLKNAWNEDGKAIVIVSGVIALGFLIWAVYMIINEL